MLTQIINIVSTLFVINTTSNNNHTTSNNNHTTSINNYNSNNSFFNKELKFFDAYFASSDYIV